MKRMERRLVALEQRPRPACSQCTDWLPTVVVEGGVSEVANPAYVDASLPYPCRCPSCGRQGIRLIRLYGGGERSPRSGVSGTVRGMPIRYRYHPSGVSHDTPIACSAVAASSSRYRRS